MTKTSRAQESHCLICLLFFNLAAVTGRRATSLRYCCLANSVFTHFFAPYKTLQTLDWHGLLEGTGQWQTAIGLTEKQTSCEERAESLPVKRLEWHLAGAPRCTVALATLSWQRKLYTSLTVPPLSVQTVPKSHLKILGLFVLTVASCLQHKLHFLEFSCMK